MDRLVEEALAKVNNDTKDVDRWDSDERRSKAIARAINACKALISSLKSIS